MVHDIASKIAVEIAILGLVFCALVAAPCARAQTVTTSVFSGAAPYAVAVNPVTNKIYVANQNAGSVTVIDGATNNIVSVSTGSSPDAIAVDPVTNQIYVANLGSGTVTVIDGPTNATTTLTLPAGSAPNAIAVDAATNIVFVADEIAGTGSVTIINGASDTPAVTAAVATSLILAAGSEPTSLAVDPVTDLVYVATQNGGAGGVTIVNGASNSLSGTVVTGSGPVAVAVNPITNTIYVANQGGNSVTVINGSTDGTTSVPVGSSPAAVAVNPVSNVIYVANSGGAGSVSVISGATNSVSATISGAGIGPSPSAMAVNATTNEIYVANYSNSNGSVSAISGATNAVTATLTTSAGPHAVAVNSTMDKIYVADLGTNIVTVIDGATNTPTLATVGSDPLAGAADPATNQVYVANFGSQSVTVFNGRTNAIAATIPVGSNPIAVADDPLTSEIYVANLNSASVTAINATTNTAINVPIGPVGSEPTALAANPLTDKIYVANEQGNSITVINGATNSTVQVPVGTKPVAVAVNPVSDNVYVVNELSNDVTVVSGATNVATTVSVGADPTAVAVNQVTNRIYVANEDGTVTVINGATNTTATVAVGSGAVAVAVNPITNMIYVVNQGSNNVTVISGATNGTATVPTGSSPVAVAVNPVTNKIYVANSFGSTVTVIDGATNSVSTVAAGNSPSGIVVNPITNTVFVSNTTSGNVSVFPEAGAQAVPLTTTIAPLAGNQFIGAPTFNFTTASTFAPNAPAVADVYFQVDTWQGPWLAATGGGNSFSGGTGAIGVGAHILYAFAADAQAATANGLSSPLIGSITAYEFTIIPEATSTVLTSNAGNPNTAGSSITFTATVTPAGAEIPTGLVTFADGSTTLGSVPVHTVGVTGVATFAISTLVPGPHSITATYGGDANTASSVSATLPIQIGPQTTSVTLTSAPNPGFLGGPVTFTATVTPQVGGTPTGTVTFVNSSTNPATTLGQGTLQPDGVASAMVSSLALGTYTINANYSGDALDDASTTSTPLTQTVGAASFAISAIPTTQTVTVGQNGLYLIAVEPEGNYSTAVTLTCNLTTLPAESVCTFTPPTVTPGTTTATVSLSISTVAPTTTSRLTPPVGGAPFDTFGAFGGILVALVILCALLIDGIRKQRRGAFARFGMAVAVVVAMGMALASCHKTAATTTTGTPTGQYLITVTGTGSTVLATSSTNITLNIDAASTN
ncbi:MAG: Ig-like domain repeat protein [Candidatus Acidiferrales bacterium]